MYFAKGFKAQVRFLSYFAEGLKAQVRFLSYLAVGMAMSYATAAAYGFFFENVLTGSFMFGVRPWDHFLYN